MGKIEKQNLLPSNCRYFDKTFIEMIFKKSCFSHIFLAHCLFVLVSMETIIQKNGKRKYLKNYLLKTIHSMKLRLYRNIHQISLERFCVIYENQLSSLVAMATWSFYTLQWVELKNDIYCQAIADILTKLCRNIP